MHAALARDHWCEEVELPIEERGAAVAGRVFLIEPVSFVAASLSSALAALAFDVEVFEDGDEFFARVDPDAWGCVMLRLSSLGCEGVHILEELGRRGMAIPVILVDADGEAMATVDLRDREPPLAGAARRRSLAERVRYSLNERSRRRQRRLARAEVRERLARLRDREREVTERVAAGQPNKVIAIELGISDGDAGKSKLLVKGAPTTTPRARAACRSASRPGSRARRWSRSNSTAATAASATSSRSPT